MNVTAWAVCRARQCEQQADELHETRHLQLRVLLLALGHQVAEDGSQRRHANAAGHENQVPVARKRQRQPPVRRVDLSLRAMRSLSEGWRHPGAGNTSSP